VLPPVRWKKALKKSKKRTFCLKIWVIRIREKLSWNYKPNPLKKPKYRLPISETTSTQWNGTKPNPTTQWPHLKRKLTINNFNSETG
jgi:hypothetical protein